MAVNLSLTKEQVQLLLPMLQQITDLDTRSDQMAVQTPKSARAGHPTANGSWSRYQWQFGSSGSSKPELWMSISQVCRGVVVKAVQSVLYLVSTWWFATEKKTELTKLLKLTKLPACKFNVMSPSREVGGPNSWRGSLILGTCFVTQLKHLL